MLVGFGPGGGTDNIARLYAVKLQEILNTPVIVENKPGASEVLAAQPVMAAAPDGYTLWLGTGSALAQGPGVRKDLPYDPLKNFTPVALVADGEAVLSVRPGVPAHSLGELIAYAKANPGKLNYGSAGVGAGNHLLAEYISLMTGISMVHVPYKSDVEVTRDAVAGNVDFALTTVAITRPFVTEGKLRALAVTGNQRLKTLPDVPSVAESGVPELRSMGSYTFFGLMGPTGLPPAVVQRLSDAINQIAAMPDVGQRMREGFMFEPTSSTPAGSRQYIERELTKWRELGKNLKVGN
ncbi:MAG: tripartite tricarboxylate transporter substrate binding protein [Variovorax sp.]|nr:MAG: tripartite tricarboxylate transporter substrate binding protein [Variovorax sp.]